MMQGREEVEQRVPRGTFELLEQYVGLLTAAASEQNLISHSTIALIWQRHVLDSLQLLDLADRSGRWVDVGSGAGLPGLVVAIAGQRRVTLIEPRRRRAEFLMHAVDVLGLASHVDVVASRSETAQPGTAEIVSARAVAPLTQIFAMAEHFTGAMTQWILPKGQSAADEVEIARRTWQGEFGLVPSLTKAGSSIVVARNVQRRGQR